MSGLLADMPSVKAVELIPFHLLGREKYASLGVPCPYPSDIEPGEEHMRALEAILRDAGLPVRTQQKEINHDDEDYT